MVCLTYIGIDELARRGTKRPFSSSTEDDLGRPRSQASPPMSSQNSNQGGGGVDGWWEGADNVDRLRVMDESFSSEAPQRLQREPGGKPLQGTRAKKGLGDQLMDLFHHWGHKQQPSGFFLRCYACGASSNLSSICFLLSFFYGH